MITWAMGVCLKLAAMGIAVGCQAQTGGVERAEFTTDTAALPSYVVRCQSKACRDFATSLEETHVVIPMPRRGGFILLARPALDDVVGRVVWAKGALDR